MFVDMANRLHCHDDAVHVVAYVVSGIDFLCAGVIMRGEGNVRGLNTAPALWGSAAVGTAAVRHRHTCHSQAVLAVASACSRR